MENLNSTYEKILTNSTPNAHGDILSICFFLPPAVSSNGIWEHLTNPKVPLFPSNELFPLLEWQIFLIFFITFASHFVLKRFGLPLFISQIVAGFILGPSIRALHYNAFQRNIFPYTSQEVIGTISSFGYSLFLFITGVKTDLGRIKKAGKLPLAIGILSLILPLALGRVAMSISAHFLDERSHEKKNHVFQLIAVTQSMTSFTVVACLLDQLRIINSELGRLGLSAALVNDTISLVLQCGVSFFAIYVREGHGKVWQDVISLICFILAIVFVIRPAMFWIVKNTPAGRPVEDEYLYAIIVFVFGCAMFSHFFDESVLLGPYILGLSIPAGPPLGSRLVKKLDCFISGLLLPLFVTISVIRVDLSFIKSDTKLLAYDVILLVVTLLTKVAACLAPSLYCKMHLNDALALAVTMCTKGVVELATYSFLHDIQAVDDQTFGVLVISLTILATIIPLLVNYLHDPSRKYACYQKRNIINLKPNEELRMLTCVHTESNIPAMIKLLDVACPTRENQVSIYALHLIELTGGSFPVFVSYQLGGKKILSHINYSEAIIFALMQYELSNNGAVSVEAFTAISPFQLMHEDICTLALDKLASLIVLPFHRQFAFSGEIESEDNVIRALNLTILERAPCSIGILVDRSHLRRMSSLYRVAMIFLGGNDDREALEFAKRVVEDPRNFSLTVIRLVSGDSEALIAWEEILDNESLKDVKYKIEGVQNAAYIEQKVMDGPQTTRVLGTIVNEYDLIVVGRRNGLNSPQTLSLETWNEFPELGIVGDILASTDFNCGASVLVVQQQRQVTSR